MLGWGVAVGGCGGRCLNQDLRDLMIFGIRARTGGACVGICGMGRGCGWLAGGRCLNQDLRDLRFSGLGRALEERCVGMGRGCGWLRWALSESGFAGFEDFRD